MNTLTYTLFPSDTYFSPQPFPAITVSSRPWAVITQNVSMQYLPFWFGKKFYFTRPSLWWHIISVLLSSSSTHYWNYNWLCLTLVPSIIKTHQSDKPILDVKTKFIRYGLWETVVHSIGLHVNSVEGSCCWLCCFSSQKSCNVAVSWAFDTWITVSVDEIEKPAQSSFSLFFMWSTWDYFIQSLNFFFFLVMPLYSSIIISFFIDHILFYFSDIVLYIVHLYKYEP